LKNGASSTTIKCIKKSEFTIEIQEIKNDQLNIESIQWNILTVQSNVSFTDYVNMDEEISVLSDAEIL